MRKTTNKILSALIAASLVFGMVTTASAASEGDTAPTAASVQETVETSAEDQQEPAAEETVTEEPAAEESEEQKEEAPAAAEEEKAEEQKEEAPAEEAPAEEIAPAEEAAPAEEVAPAEEEAVETVSEPEEETAAAMPAQTFSKTVKEKVKGKKKTVVKVEVSAPEGAFPEGTEMTVTKVGENDRVGGRKRGKTYRQAIESVARSDVKTIMAVDITFTKDGKEIEPAKDISVSFKSDSLAAKEGQTLSIVHIADDGSAEVIKDAEINEKKQEATFDAGDFSVYAVLGEEETGDNARLFVTFEQANDGDPITIPVKKTDMNTEIINGESVNHFEQVLYDPGVGVLNGRQTFLGWTDKEDYTLADKDNAMTIKEVREAVKTKLNAGVEEGETLTYYPMIMEVYSVTFLDEDGAGIKTDSIYVLDDSSTSYTIDEDYDPKSTDARFEGWGVASQDSDGKWVLPDEADMTKYQNGNSVSFGSGENDLTDDLVLRAFVPSGYWLIFKENGDGASFTPAEFYRGRVTVQPTPNPTRFGYTFGGWYLEPECTNAFTFGNELTETTRVYAKWNPIARAPYTVIIWTENIACDGYDFKEAVTVANATVGQNTNVTGAANETTVTIPGNNRSYTGFHLREAPTNVEVRPEGTSYVNVYFDRTEYTFTFRANANHYFNAPSQGVSTSSNPLTTIHTVKRKYDQDISDIWSFTGSDGYTYPETNANTSWQPSGSTTYTARITAMERMPAENISFTLVHTNNTTRYFHYYIEVPDGETGTRTFQGRQFNLYMDLPNDFNIVYYNDDFWNLKGFDRLAIAKSNDEAVQLNAGGRVVWDAYSGHSLNGSYGGDNNQLYFYYTRQQYPITYWDGKYVDGNGNEITENVTDRGLLHKSAVIDFDASIASYGKNGDDYYAAEDKTPQGFAFAGWFSDKSCTLEYNFNKMPIDGVRVYAKWVRIQYRVFLYPNATDQNQTGVGNNDPTFESGEQGTCFRIDWGEELSINQMLRGEYEFNGWYTDPSLSPSSAFSPSSFTANDSEVTTDYDRTESTERNIYGDIEEDRNADAAANRFWINHKLELYARWRHKLIGTDGITVIYESGEDGQFADQSTTFTDPLRYQDDADAVAQGAATATKKGKEFKQWVVQEWNGEEFVPTGTTRIPGETFKVDSTKAQIVDNDTGEIVRAGTTLDSNGHYTYTIKLVAEYGSIEAPTPTHITWYSNIKDVAGNELDKKKFSGATDTFEEGKGYCVSEDPVNINQGYDIKSAETFSYPGYTFLGWAKLPTNQTPENYNPKEDDLFLKWVDDHYEAKNGDEWVPVTQVAADENQPYDDLYAVWKGSCYIYHSGVEGDGNLEVIDMPGPGKNINLIENLTEGTLYGGYYLDYAGKGDYESGSSVKGTNGVAYNGWNYDWSDAQTVNEDTAGSDGYKDQVLIHPEAGKTYYIKEVPNYYLRNYHQINYMKTTQELMALYLISAVDDENYTKYGVTLTNGDKEVAIYTYIKFTNYATNRSVTLTAKSMFGASFGLNEEGRDDAVAKGHDRVTFWDATKSEYFKEGSFTVKPFWVTKDGVKVSGVSTRTINITSMTRKGVTKVDKVDD